MRERVEEGGLVGSDYWGIIVFVMSGVQSQVVLCNNVIDRGGSSKGSNLIYTLMKEFTYGHAIPYTGFIHRGINGH